MPRTASPLTAIRRIREELDRLEAQVVGKAAIRSRKATVRRVKAAGRRAVCSVCRKPGHNARRHKRGRKSR